MTTIDIKLKMNSRNQDSFLVRIVRDEAEDGGDIIKPKLVPGGGKNRMKKQPHSIDVSSEMFYSGDQFTITAYLPTDEMEGGEKQKRLKIPCYAGMTVQQVIENELTQLANTSYVVYQFPSKALLNPEKDASVLQGQEIWIEPSRMDTDEPSDPRLAIVMEFHRTEDAYLEHLRNIFDVYMEPLSTWGISQSDMNTLFLPLSRLCDLLMNFFSELELAVKSWNTLTTQIGGIFKQYPSFWKMHIEYAQNYTVAMRLLKQKRQDESFKKFLEIKRGAAIHTLESLMLLPVQRVSDYNRYLMQLINLTPRDHVDFQNIRLTLARTEEIIQARADELVYLQNESKLEQVQLQFPQDHLFLSDAFDLFEVQKRRSHSQTPTSMHRHKSNKSGYSQSDSEGTDGLGSRKNLRMYIQEGPVKLFHVTLNKQIEQERYMFLFSDLLLVAKPKAGRTNQHRCYRLKKKLRLGEMWISEYNSSYGHGHRPECSFIIGWPLDSCFAYNCIATFSDESLKSLWFTHISKHIQMQRKLCISDSFSTHIYNSTKYNNPSNIPAFLCINVSDSVQDVIQNALNVFEIKEPGDSFQLWVKLPKEDREEVLLGFESPFAIQDHHNKLQIEHGSDTKPQQLEFILKRKPDQTAANSRVSTGIFKFGRRKDKNKRFTKPQSRKVKMFGVPLEQLIVNNQLPEKLQEILIRLWVEGPATFGIFRQTPSVRKIREIREGIDGNEPVDLTDVSLHVIGAVLKDLLRNVPGGVIPSARYTEFVATNDINEYELRIQKIRMILNKLPYPNQTFLRYLLPLLSHISHHEEENGMSSTNLAICFAPSLLEPEFSLYVIKNEAPTLVDFMITHAPEIYSREIPDLFKQLSSSQQERDIRYIVPLKDEDDTEMSEGGGYYRSHNRNHSLDMCTSASEDSLDEDEMTPRHVSLLHTSSDSNVTDVYSTLSSNKSGRMTLLSDRSEEVSTGIEGDQSDMDEEEYDNDYDPHRTIQQQSRLLRTRHGSVENAGRRRTIGTQSSVNKHHYSPDLSSSHGPKPRMMGYTPSYSPNSSSHYADSMDSDATGFNGNRSEPNIVNKQGHKKKKRKAAGHSNSFTKTSDLTFSKEAKIPQSSSLSFGYDSLSPNDRPRSRSIAATQTAHIPHEDNLLTKSLEHTTHNNSNQSISSRTSGSSTGSQTHSRGTQTQPQKSDLVQPVISNRPRALTQVSTASDHIKSDEVRLRLLSGGMKTPGANSTATNNPLLYDSDVSQDTLIPADEDYEHKGLRGSMITDDHRHGDTGYHSYKPTHPPEMIKRVESVETTTSIDDRPEAERHLNGSRASLPRNTGTSTEDYKQLLATGGSLGRKGPFNEIMPLGHYTSDNGSRLTISSAGGYNSDTESSPSRTLNRQDKKLEEVSSPQTMRSSIPNRYYRPMEGGVATVTDNKSVADVHKVSVSSHRTQTDSNRARSSAGNHALMEERENPNERRPRSVNQFTSSSHHETPPNTPSSSSQAKKNRSSTYEVYQKLYEKESISNKAALSPTGEGNNEDKKLSLSMEVQPSSTKEELGIDVTGSKILSVPLASRDPSTSSKSRSMPDYAKRSSTRTLTASSAVKTVKVVRYDLPTPKRIRRINLRAYNTK